VSAGSWRGAAIPARSFAAHPITWPCTDTHPRTWKGHHCTLQGTHPATCCNLQCTTLGCRPLFPNITAPTPPACAPPNPTLCLTHTTHPHPTCPLPPPPPRPRSALLRRPLGRVCLCPPPQWATTVLARRPPSVKTAQQVGQLREERGPGAGSVVCNCCLGLCRGQGGKETCPAPEHACCAQNVLCAVQAVISCHCHTCSLYALRCSPAGNDHLLLLTMFTVNNVCCSPQATTTRYC
jgi:hypothetical protein